MDELTRLIERQGALQTEKTRQSLRSLEIKLSDPVEAEQNHGEFDRPATFGRGKIFDEEVLFSKTGFKRSEYYLPGIDFSRGVSAEKDDPFTGAESLEDFFYGPRTSEFHGTRPGYHGIFSKKSVEVPTVLFEIREKHLAAKYVSKDRVTVVTATLGGTFSLLSLLSWYLSGTIIIHPDLSLMTLIVSIAFYTITKLPPDKSNN